LLAQIDRLARTNDPSRVASSLVAKPPAGGFFHGR
jgi:hypothetical protein